jgi:hypothetical protein
MKTRMTLLIIAGLFFNLAAAKAQETQIKASHYQSKPIVKMTLNGKKIWALLDTGTASTIIDLNAKEDYGFRTFISSDSEYVVAGVGPNNYHQLHQVRNAEILYLETELKRKVFAYNLQNIVSSIQERTGKKITAIIGSEMMCAYGFVIDLGEKTVMLQSKKDKKNLAEATSARGL